MVPFELNATRMATSRSADFWAKQRLLDPETARHRYSSLPGPPPWHRQDPILCEGGPLRGTYFCRFMSTLLIVNGQVC